jgi:hypothetical protein
MFWPVSLNTALKMRWDGRLTCYVQNGHCRTRGAAAIRELLGPDGSSPIPDLYLDLPTRVIMSRHGLDLSKEARRFTWEDTRLERLGGGTHVMAYSARGSHAMYERCGDFRRAEA